MLITVLLINLLTLIRSFLNYRNPEIVYNWARDPFALISIIAFLLLTVIIFGTMLWHYLVLKRRYSKRRDCPLNKLKRQEYNKNCADITRTYLEYREEGYSAKLLNSDQATEFVEVEEDIVTAGPQAANQKPKAPAQSSEETVPSPPAPKIYIPHSWSLSQSPAPERLEQNQRYYPNAQQPRSFADNYAPTES